MYASVDHDVAKTQTGPSRLLNEVKRHFRPIYARVVDALPDQWHVLLDYVKFHRRLPNLKHPRTFNEKIAWRKLFDRDPRLPMLMDKILVKEIIGQRHGYDLINPTLAVYDSASEMDFTKWPLAAPPYVVKANHGSGMNLFVKDEPVDCAAVIKALDTWLKVDHSVICEEWGYSQIEPRILVEPLLGVGASVTDYKFHVFSGSVYAIEVVFDRFGDYHINFYTPQWNLLDVKRYAGRPGRGRAVPPPQRLKDMVRLAEAIGREFTYVRVDLYEIEERIKFGELTFYTGAANDRFEPPEWDMEFGKQWALAALEEMISQPHSARYARASARLAGRKGLDPARRRSDGCEPELGFGKPQLMRALSLSADTPMVSLSNTALPGLGNQLSAKVIFDAGRYARTWLHGKFGGHMWGRIERADVSKSEPAADQTSPAAKPLFGE